MRNQFAKQSEMNIQLLQASEKKRASGARKMKKMPGAILGPCVAFPFYTLPLK